MSSKVAPIGSKKKKNSKDKKDKKGDNNLPLDPNQQSLSHPSVEDEEIPADVQKESRVGKRLSELTTKRVIVIVLSLIMFVPMFQADLFFDFDKGYTMGIVMIQTYSEENYPQTAATTVNIDKGWELFKNSFLSETYPLTYAKIPSLTTSKSWGTA
jgi:hypothetical protein